jgi:hypothetical protein
MESNTWKINSSMIYRRLGGGVGTIKLQKDSVLYNLTPNILNVTPNNNQQQQQQQQTRQFNNAPSSNVVNLNTQVLTANHGNAQRPSTTSLPANSYLTNNLTASNNSVPNNNNNSSWPFILSPVPSLLANVPQNNVSSLISNSASTRQQTGSLGQNHSTFIATIASSDTILSDFGNLNINANTTSPSIGSLNADLNTGIDSSTNLAISNPNSRLLDI